MTRFTRFLAFLSILLPSFFLRHLQTTMAGSPSAEGKEVILKAADITPKIFPERVFFRGQSASVQFRNSGGGTRGQLRLLDGNQGEIPSLFAQ